MKEVRELVIWVSVGRVFQEKERGNVKAIRWTFAFTFEELKRKLCNWSRERKKAKNR